MKNFFKKLSFVMAAAMVITSLQVPAAKAATKDGILVKGKNVTKRTVFVGGVKVNFDYKIGKYNNKGANGKWSTDNEDVITVDKSGKVTAHATGSANLILKVKKNTKKGIKKNMTYKVKVNVLARAKSLEIPASDKAISLKVGEKKEVMPILTDKVEGVKHSYKLFATSDNATDVAVTAVGDKVLVEAKNATATSATVTVSAAIKKGDKISVSDSFTVDVRPNLDAKQAGANKIIVKGMDLSTDAAMYVVKTDKGATVTLKKDVVVNEDKTEAILTADSARILKGNYVLTYNKSTEVKFDVVDVVVSEIKFKDAEKAVKTAAKQARVQFEILDQFGNDITASIPTTDINVVSNLSHAFPLATTGVIELTTTADKLTPNFDKISLTLVYKNNGVNVSSLFTVADEAKLWEVEYKGLYSVDKKAIVESLSESDKLDKFYVLFSAKDQYGRAFTDASAAKDNLNVVLLGASGLDVDKTKPTSHDQEVNGVKYIAYQLKATATTGKFNFGEVNVMAIGLNNGTKASGKFNVTHAVKVNTFSVREGVKGVYAGQDNEIEFEALDMNDKPITDLKVLKDFTPSIKSSVTSTFEFKKDDKTGKITLTFNPTVTSLKAGEATSVPVVVSGTTESYKFFNNTLVVNNKKAPVALIGVKSDAVTGALSGKHLKLGLDVLRFQDQFGMEMSAKEVADLYTSNEYQVNAQVFADDAKTATDKFVLGTDGTAYPTALANVGADVNITKTNVDLATKDNLLNIDAADKTKKGNAKVTVTLKGATVEEKNAKHTFVIKNIDLADVSKFEVKTPDLVPTDDIHATVNFIPSVFGYFEGAKISLTHDDFVVFEGVEDAGKKVALPRIKKEAIKEGETTKTLGYKVIINDGKATEVTSNFTVSKAAPIVTSVKYKATAALTTGDYANGFAWAATTSEVAIGTGANFEMKDQYGQDITTAPYVTYSIKDEDAGKVTVEHNGRKDATLKIAATVPSASGAVANTGTYTVGIKLVFPGTAYVYEGTIQVKKN